MRVHKEIKINTEVIDNSIKHKYLIGRAIYAIEQYNEKKKKSLCFTYTGSCSRAAEWGYLQTGDIKWLDSYFIGSLGMKAETEAGWDNKTAERYYFFEE